MALARHETLHGARTGSECRKLVSTYDSEVVAVKWFCGVFAGGPSRAEQKLDVNNVLGKLPELGWYRRALEPVTRTRPGSASNREAAPVLGGSASYEVPLMPSLGLSCRISVRAAAYSSKLPIEPAMVFARRYMKSTS